MHFTDFIITEIFNFLFRQIQRWSPIYTISAFVLIQLTFNTSAQSQLESTSFEIKTKVESRLAKMSLEEKVGQLFIFGFRGKTINENLKNHFRSLSPGGIIIFRHNIESAHQLYQLNKNLQKISFERLNLPLLIMVDQEGGSVTRFKINPASPSALALGMSQNTKLVRQIGGLTGQLLSLLGFNMNLAPVLDLSDPWKKSFISNRSFGQNPEEVKIFGEAFSSGLLDAGIIPTAKHFPGHGGNVSDSHRSLPKKFDQLNEIEKNSLIPFDWFGKFQYPSAIMVAHIAFPNIDPSGVPATFSKIILTDILRQKLNYPGLIITDDIEMAAAQITEKISENKINNIGERAIRAIESGCDLVMVAWTPKRQAIAYKEVIKAVNSGRISLKKLDDSVTRILNFKLTIQTLRSSLPQNISSDHLSSDHLDLSTNLNSIINEIRDVTEKISQENFKRSIVDYPTLSNISLNKDKAFIYTADPKFFVSFRRAWGEKTYLKLMKPGQSLSIFSFLKKTPHAFGVFYLSGTGTAKILNQLDEKIKNQVIVINTTHPGILTDTNPFMAVINIHSRNFNSGYWLAEYLKSNSTQNMN